MAENNKKYRFETLQLHVGQDRPTRPPTPAPHLRYHQLRLPQLRPRRGPLQVPAV